MSEQTIFAHRGASGTHFENTMSAFRAAVKQGADGIELDVQQTSDGHLVVIHDENLQRLAGIDRQINEISSVELSQVKVGRTGSRRLFGHPVPSLFDVVQFCAEEQLALNIELKETVYRQPEVIERILNYVECLSCVHISSFDYETLRLVKQLDPCMETGLLVKKKTVSDNDLAGFDTDAIHFHKRLWKEPYQELLIDCGKTLRMYGVTGKEAFISQSKGISGWITDYPKRFAKK